MIHSLGIWTTTGSMYTARVVQTASILTNGKVLVTGGYNGAFLNSAELYDALSGLWITPEKHEHYTTVSHSHTLNKWKSVSYWWI